MANVFKMFATGPIRQTIGRTAALSYPNKPSVHHKEVRSTAATSHELRPVKPSFCISAPPQRSPHPEVGQITRTYRAWQALGIPTMAGANAGKTGVTADRDKIEFRMFNSSSIFNITLREELFGKGLY